MHEYLNNLTSGYWEIVTSKIIFSTEHIIGLAALLSVSYALAAHSDTLRRREISLFYPLFTAFACYVVLMVWDYESFKATAFGQPPEAHFSNPGQMGVFFGLFVAVVSTKLFILFAQLWQKTPWFSRRIVGSYSLVRGAIHAIVPILFTLLCFIALRIFFDWLYTATGLQSYIEGLLSSLVNDGRLPFVLITVLIMQIMWFFGAHGSFTMQTFMEHIEPAAATNATATNAMQLAAAEAPSSTTLFTNWEFYNVFIEMGGTGTTMALLIAILVFGSAGRGKRLGRISIFPVAFNINETLLFGIPIVFNPFMLIPFILAPLVAATVAYGALFLGIVPPAVTFVEWTTPVLLSGYLATGSLAGSVLQVVCIGLAFLIYAPFVIATKKGRESYQLKLFERFKIEASSAADNEQASLSNRNDDIGAMANQFITEINMTFDGKNSPFFMVYQPKTDDKGRVAGAEALLRWTHPVYGPIPPNILIELTDEAELTTAFGRWITTEALEEFARWQEDDLACLVLSINLNPHHIFVDDEFPGFLEQELKRLGINPAQIDLEITEHVAVGASKNMLQMFKRLRALGVRLSIDDMGMGYSSLTYISDFGASVVKIDISLIDQVDTNVQQQEIVRSVVELARQINLTVIVEGVETAEQAKTLTALGCRYFQGYFFSKPLEPKDFLSYVKDHGTTILEHEGML